MSGKSSWQLIADAGKAKKTMCGLPSPQLVPKVHSPAKWASYSLFLFFTWLVESWALAEPSWYLIFLCRSSPMNPMPVQPAQGSPLSVWWLGAPGKHCNLHVLPRMEMAVKVPACFLHMHGKDCCREKAAETSRQGECREQEITGSRTGYREESSRQDSSFQGQGAQLPAAAKPGFTWVLSTEPRCLVPVSYLWSHWDTGWGAMSLMHRNYTQASGEGTRAKTSNAVYMYL